MTYVMQEADSTAHSGTNGLSRFWHRVKVARMESALRHLSDHQLELMGVSRAALSEHAEYLMSYEYDGL